MSAKSATLTNADAWIVILGYACLRLTCVFVRSWNCLASLHAASNGLAIKSNDAISAAQCARSIHKPSLGSRIHILRSFELKMMSTLYIK